MRLVIADTGPINYLVLIEEIELLPRLFEKVILPGVVRDELMAGPIAFRMWASGLPAWVDLMDASGPVPATSRHLDAGEEEAIRLAVQLDADLLLMDDREGVLSARKCGLTVTGTLGVLGLASRRGLIDLGAAFDRLKRTNFHYRQSLMDQLLRERIEEPKN